MNQPNISCQEMNDLTSNPEAFVSFWYADGCKENPWSEKNLEGIMKSVPIVYLHTYC